MTDDDRGRRYDRLWDDPADRDERLDAYIKALDEQRGLGIPPLAVLRCDRGHYLGELRQVHLGRAAWMEGRGNVDVVREKAQWRRVGMSRRLLDRITSDFLVVPEPDHGEVRCLTCGRLARIRWGDLRLRPNRAVIIRGDDR